jgi:type VI secretion system protein ImpL
MSKLLAQANRKWLVSVLGLLALALLIWYVGPLLAIAGWSPLEGEAERLLAVAALASIWALRQLQVRRREQHANAEFVDKIAEVESLFGVPEADAELATLRRRFQDALEALKAARLGGGRRFGGRQYLYQLPWYLIIGPPGAGKTTALVNSGLRFPLGERLGNVAVRGVGGTRDCDWWFTDEAVLIDTAGRYTTQDSSAALDSAAWQGFLQLLKEHRPRRPINGVAVAISLLDLMQFSVSELARHADTVRERLRELHRVLGIRIPVYVLLTKVDLVAGFVEFFDDLGREERGQVLGMTFPYGKGESAGTELATRFDADMALLQQRLHGRIVERLHEERERRRRELIYEFPRQLGSARAAVREFLVQVFGPRPGAEAAGGGAMLRGVYFTSGTQEGTPIDRLMGALARDFGFDRQRLLAFSGAGRSYFIKYLLTGVIFAESELASLSSRLERRLVWLRAGSYALCGLLLVGAVAAWTLSYLGNRDLVAEVDRAAADLDLRLGELTAPGLAESLPTLEAARELLGVGGTTAAELPGLMGLGLYQGEKLGAAAAESYRRVLRTVLLPRLLYRLEQQLRRPDADRDFLQRGLQTYLMLGTGEDFDAATVSAWFESDWDQEPPDSAIGQLRQRLSAHLQALAAEMPMPLVVPLDKGLIENLRGRLEPSLGAVSH